MKKINIITYILLLFLSACVGINKNSDTKKIEPQKLIQTLIDKELKDEAINACYIGVLVLDGNKNPTILISKLNDGVNDKIITKNNMSIKYTTNMTTKGSDVKLSDFNLSLRVNKEKGFSFIMNPAVRKGLSIISSGGNVFTNKETSKPEQYHSFLFIYNTYLD